MATKFKPNFKVFIPPKLSPDIVAIISSYKNIIDILKHMNISFVINLFESLNITDIISININKVGYFYDHYFVYIKSIITRDKDEIIINQMFYKSSGLSRSTGLKDIWLPTTGINFNMIKKLEDEYIIRYDNLKKEKTGTLQLLVKNHSTKDAVDESFSNSAALQKFTTLLQKKFETEFPFTVPLHYSDSFDIVLIAKLANLKDSIGFVVATNKIKAFGKKS